ncbi:hypothetical protein AB0I28_20115 [Phytomonospora sp. NPDC050363]|uniref:hypothetical protein n=1 Tax=Phytomonospora sp. NPDC050363 TaxID=3155642 RepID=UPI0033CDDC6F
MTVPAVLDANFADPHARPAQLVNAFCGLYVPIHPDAAIAAAALRADPARVRAVGRWLVRRLCGAGDVTGPERSWLLRRSCDPGLDGYYAGKVAVAANLHDAITAPDADDELVDHTGRLLRSMLGCSGMGLTPAEYPPAPQVVEAHARHLARQKPSAERFAVAAALADRLADLAEHASRLASLYLAVLDREDWRPLAPQPIPAG